MHAYTQLYQNIFCWDAHQLDCTKAAVADACGAQLSVLLSDRVTAERAEQRRL